MSAAPWNWTPADNEVSELNLQNWTGQDIDEKYTDSQAVGVVRFMTRSREDSCSEAKCEWSGGGASAESRHIRQGRSYTAAIQTNVKRRPKVCDDSRAGLNRAAELCLVREPATWLDSCSLLRTIGWCY
jgi:hypothetical protein